MGCRHEFLPGLGRQAAARHLLHRRAVIIAEPDAGGQLAGVADEKRIPERLRRAGFAGCLPTFQTRSLAGALIDDAGQHAVHGRGDAFIQNAGRVVVFVLV